MATTDGNNTLFLDASNPGTVGLGLGNDRYVLSNTSLAANQSLTISDADGANTLQLVGGLTITSSLVSNNAIQLTLSNGAKVTVLGASTFTFLTGGDAFSGTGGVSQTFSQFVTVALGATVPAANAAAVPVGPVTLVSGGTTTPGTGQTFTLTNSATADAPTLTAGSDTIDSAAGTLATTDRIVDASGTDNDVFNVTVNGYTPGAIQPTVIGIETINANGAFTTTGFDLLNTINAKVVNVNTGIASGTATVNNASSNATPIITAGANISNLTVTAAANGTGTNVTVNAGPATTVAITGGAANDVMTLNAAAASAVKITDAGATLGDAYTVNLSGGINSLDIATAGGTIETLNLNSNTAANTVTLAGVNPLAGVAAGNKVTVGGTQTLKIVGDGDAIAGASRTTGVVIEKAAGAGAVTFTNNAATASFFNRALVDTLDLTAVIAAATVTVNEATTLKLSFDQGAATYNVDNNTSTAIAAGVGTLKLDLAASQATSTTIGASVGTVIMTANASNVTLAVYDTGTTATTVDTTSISGTKAVTIASWAHTVDDIISAASLTGKLTIASASNNAGVIIAGSGDDSITITGNSAIVIRGGAGSDTINGNAANTAKVTAYGDAGNDAITGGTLGDLLDGGEGNDTIIGGAGGDTMTGGTGNDVFQFDNTVASTPTDIAFDIITDFVSAADTIDYINASITVQANPAAATATVASISATGLATFTAGTTTLAQKLVAVEGGIAVGTSVAGEAAIFTHEGSAYIFIGDGAAGVGVGDFLIKLTGIAAPVGLTVNGFGDISGVV